MKVTPHKVIETVRRPEFARYCYDMKIIPSAIGALEEAVMFEFGETKPDPAHNDFAVDLYKRELFALPFPVTAISFEGQQRMDKLGVRKAGAMIVLGMSEERGLYGAQFSEVIDPGTGQSWGAIPVCGGVNFEIKKATDEPGDCIISADIGRHITDDLMVAMYGAADHRGIDVMRNRLFSNVVNAMGLVVMMMSKGVTSTRTPAPDKLNKHRAAKGKPLIGESYVVRVNPESSSLIASGDGYEDISGHTRGSPRPHWRRGHFRTIYRDTPEERVIPIAPMLVAANEESNVTHAVYKMRQQKNG